MSFNVDIKKDLDEAEFIILNDNNIKKYGLDPKDLYSFDKITDNKEEINSQSIKIRNINSYNYSQIIYQEASGEHQRELVI